MSQPNDLHPIFDRVIPRTEKESRFNQRARVIWLYGLSGSGKSTLATALERRLFADGLVTHLLDGDNVRTGLNRNLGFSDADRDENLRRVAEVAKLFVQAGVITLCSFITPKRAQRAAARATIGAEDFLEVYVHASYETCAARDPKGLYAKAQAGQLKTFTGKDSSFEPPQPEDGSFILDTERESPEASLERLLTWVLPRVKIS
ncbi:MAG TPA: adenylyl-sulfate kinase [Opitutaceae bacterium]